MACSDTPDELLYSPIMLRHSSDDDTATRSAHTDEAGGFETRSRRSSSVMRSESTTPANTIPLVHNYDDNEVEAAYPSNAKPTLNRPPQSPTGEVGNPKPYKNTSGDWWEWELFGIVGSAVALGGIILVLRLYQDKPQPSWEHISLNALISWLSTVAKLLILIPISRSLGQLKWVWFKQRHMPLLDMEVFDSASRGVMGSYAPDLVLKMNVLNSLYDADPSESWAQPYYVFDASVETLNASTGSSYKETMTASYPLNIDVAGEVVDTVIENQTFGVDWPSSDAISSYLQDILEGYVLRNIDALEVVSLDTSVSSNGTGSGEMKTETPQAIYSGNFSRCSNPDHKVECAFKNIARALTKSMRDAAYIRNGTSGANMTMGETYVPVTHVGVRWYWMALPVTVWILSVVTFLGTVWTTRQANVQPWRNSPIPLLFLDIDQGERRSLWEDGVSNDACLRKAEQLSGKLEIEEDGATLVSHS
ncbi:hypothetical protein SLS54_008532 [Diplodia seriata]